MKRTVLPLVGTAFELGKMNEAIEQIEDKELLIVFLHLLLKVVFLFYYPLLVKEHQIPHL